MRLFFVLCTTFLCSSVWADLPKQSKISIVEEQHNFGVVPQGTLVQHNFLIKNNGNSSLRINRIVPSCGCTAGKLDPEIIEPNQTGKLSVQFDSTNFSGSQTKHLTLLTNDPMNERVELTLKGVVEPDLLVEPSRVIFKDVVKTKAGLINASQTVELKAAEGKKIVFGKVSSVSNNLEIVEVASTDGFKKLEVKLTPDVVPGELRDSISVAVSGAANRQVISIPVFASISGPRRLSQSVVSFGIINSEPDSQPVRRSVKIENLEPEALQIKSIDSPNPALKITPVAIDNGKAYVLHLDLDTTKLTGELRSVVRINTNLDSQPLILNVMAVMPPKL